MVFNRKPSKYATLIDVQKSSWYTYSRLVVTVDQGAYVQTYCYSTFKHTHGGQETFLFCDFSLGACRNDRNSPFDLSMRPPNYRQMLGVHYRIDSTEGLVLGETAAIRLLHQVRMTLPIVDITTMSHQRASAPHSITRACAVSKLLSHTVSNVHSDDA